MQSDLKSFISFIIFILIVIGMIFAAITYGDKPEQPDKDFRQKYKTEITTESESAEETSLEISTEPVETEMAYNSVIPDTAPRSPKTGDDIA